MRAFAGFGLPGVTAASIYLPESIIALAWLGTVVLALLVAFSIVPREVRHDIAFLIHGLPSKPKHKRNKGDEGA